MFKLMSKFRLIAIVGILISIVCNACGSDSNLPVNNNTNTDYDVVIVGGGISGLSCAYFLGNKKFVVLEKGSTVGGRTVSGTKSNFTYAKGTEYLGEPEEHLAQMINELGITPKEIPSPMDAYFDGNKFYYGGEGEERYLIDKSSEASYKKFVQLLLNENGNYEEIPDLNYNAHAKELDNMTASQWFNSNGIPEVYAKKYNVSSRGLFGASLDDISALSLIPEAAFDYDKDDLNATFDPNQTEEEEYADALKESSGSFTFVKGITELTNKLGDVLANKLKLSCNVTEVIKDGDKYVITYTDVNGQETTITAAKVVLAVPAPIALKIAPTVISQEKIDIMKQIKFSSYATVALFSKTPIFNKAFDLAVPDGYFFTDIYDATWVQRFYNKQEPTDYIATVYIAPNVSSDHTLDNMSDQELVNNVYKDLDKVFPGASNKITGYDIQRFPYAYPVMSLGAYDRLLQLNKLNEGSLILAGDYMIYPTFESAVESGYLAAEKVK